MPVGTAQLQAAHLASQIAPIEVIENVTTSSAAESNKVYRNDKDKAAARARANGNDGANVTNTLK